jgi:ABC-type transport system involved in multi-copper enzyme maturation permease subunit
MFGTFFLERDPLQIKDLPGAIAFWTQDVGAVSAVCLLIWVILWEFGVFRKLTMDVPDWMPTVFRIGLVLTFLAYAPSFPVMLYDTWLLIARTSGAAGPSAALQERMAYVKKYQDLSLTLGGAFAILTGCLPFLHNVFNERWRRIWALAKLSFKEAIRRRVLYAFSGILLIYLFASWFISAKHEDQVRTYVQVVFMGMTFVLLIAAAALGGFSIPADIRQQTIHTIVTKPVERFEIILGRFLGFAGLMTIVLAVMTSISLLYVLRGVDPDAAAESLKAREPLYGELHFENTQNEQGENVGREWDYRRYITAPLQETDIKQMQTAVWEMPALPDSAAKRKTVRCEYTFDIFRTTKGTENKGIFCNFNFEVAGHTATPSQFKERFEAARKESNKPDIDIENELAEELGVYEKPSQEVTDNHTQSLVIPAGILRAANKAAAAGVRDPLQIRVTCNNRTQYVGMAKFDLFLRMDDPDSSDDRFRFAMNFFKGAGGLWMQLLLVLALAVTLSTYFSGVISFLITLMIYVAGFFRPFIASVADNTNAGGGPMESMYRLVRAENIVAPLEQTATVKVFEVTDYAYRWVIGRVLEIIPDVDRFFLTSYVSEGFNISPALMIMNFLLLIGYIVPWAVLAYYLMKWREIAAPT